MAKRILPPCSTPGCGNRSDCAEHRRQREQVRGGSTQRGYGSRHQQLRAHWQRRIDGGEVILCWRCKRVRITGRDWHLGHDDHDRRIYRGPECVPCNTRAPRVRQTPGG